MDGHYDQESDDISLRTPLIQSFPEDTPAIVFTIDFENLRALYDPESLGDWAKERYQVQGCLPSAVCFGVSGSHCRAVIQKTSYKPSN